MRVWLSSGELDDWSAALQTETTAAVLRSCSYDGIQSSRTERRRRVSYIVATRDLALR